jgi:ubiquitin carboxyl-terminal hydrolase 5/13
LFEFNLAESKVEFNSEHLNQLLQMGFPENRCKKALIKTGHCGADAAMNWIFEHMDDQDIDASLDADMSTANVDVGPLVDMGFSEAHAKRALKETVMFN